MRLPRNCNPDNNKIRLEIFRDQFTTDDGRSPCPNCFRIRASLEKQGYWTCSNCGFMFIGIVEEPE